MMKTLLKRLFSPQDRSSATQFFRYLFAGAVSFLFDAGTLLLLVEYISLHYLLAAAIAFCAGVLSNYAICRLFVFHGYNRNRMLELILFFAITLVGLGLTELILYVLCDIFSWHYIPAKVLATVIVLFWNFGAKKIFLYRES